MPSLSFDEGKDGRALAIVRGGANDGDVLYLNDSDSFGRKPKPELNRTKYLKLFPKMKTADRTSAFNRIEEALHDAKPATFFDSEPTLKVVYEKVLKDSLTTKEITLDNEGLFELLPTSDPKKREVWYVAGASGSGKSYIVKGLLTMYHKLYPSRGCYLISKLKQDATLDALKFLKRINIDSLVEDYPELTEFQDCFVVFDDVDSLVGIQQKTVLTLIDDLATTGRHTCTSMAFCSHYLTRFAKTRLYLNETTNVVVYPQSTSFNALTYLLRQYIGVDPEDIKRHRKLGSRWLMYTKGFPQFMISQQDAELLHQRE